MELSLPGTKVPGSESSTLWNFRSRERKFLPRSESSSIHGTSLAIWDHTVLPAYGRMARHHEANDLVGWALCKANVPPVKEPLDLLRDNGNRLDGSTLIPWLASKAWDITVVNMLAKFYIHRRRSSVNFGGKTFLPKNICTKN